MSKYDDICSEIVHIATQAILSNDEAVKRVALGDIYHAIASVLPVDHSGADTAAKRVAALSPSAELAATIARQQDEDDLAQRLENA